MPFINFSNVVTVLLALILFVLMQKHFVEGIAGAVKS